MEKKYLFALSFVLAIFLIGFSNALSVSVNYDPLTFEHNGVRSKVLEFQVSGGQMDLSLPASTSLVDSSGNVVNIYFSALSPIVNEEKIQINVSVVGSKFNFGEIKSVPVSFYLENSSDPTDNLTKSVTLTYSNTDFCEDCGNDADLEVTIRNVKVLSGYGSKEKYWYPFDEVEIELRVQNKGSWDVEDILVEWALYNLDGEELFDGEADEIDIDSGDRETIYVKFKLDKDIEDFGDDVVVYVKAKGTIDDKDAGIHNGKETCDSVSLSVPMNIDRDFVIVEDLRVNSVYLEEGSFFNENVQCGSEVTITGNLWNIGTRDQEDLYIEIYSKELEIYEKIDFSELDSFDDQSFSYKFIVPKGLEEKYYKISLEVFDEDRKIFENSEDKKSMKEVIIPVKGSCIIVKPNFVSSELIGEAKAGKEMVFEITMSNPTTESTTLYFSSEGHESWAKFLGTEPSLFVLEAGQQVKIKFKYEILSSAEGEKMFSVIAKDQNGEVVFDNSVLVNVKEKAKIDLDNVDWKMVLIIGLNVLLLLAIILVLRKIFRRK